MITNDKDFWGIIKDIKWKTVSVTTNPVEKASKNLNCSLTKNKASMDSIENTFQDIVSLINEETKKRCKKNIEVFASDVYHGSDDCHFMDLPAHIIGLGRNEVLSYLNGGLISYEPVECLSYVFNKRN